MAMENFISIIMTFYRGLSLMEDVKVKVGLLNQMVVIMMGISKIMLLMDMVSILAKRALDMRANGKIMFLMVLVRPLTLTDHDILANF